VFLELSDRMQVLMWAGVYEPTTTSIFRRLLRPGAVVVDVGAHIGYFSLLASGVVGEAGCVHACEADPELCMLLARNCEGRTNVRIHGVAVGDRVGLAAFWKSSRPGESGWGTLHPETERRNAGAAEAGHAQVSMSTLDAILQEEPRAIDLLKIDTEGSELAVLRGAAQTIQRGRPVMIVEVNEVCLRRAGSSSEELRRFLSSFGYEVMGVNDGRGRPSGNAVSWPREARARVMARLGRVARFVEGVQLA
jgi:FkbM family methyltransferase